MERLILATAGAADLIQSVENVSQKEASHFCYRGVANLIELTGRANEHWNVVGLVSLTFSSNHNARKPITTLQAPSIDRLHGDHDSQIAVTLGTGALEVLRHGTY